MRAPWPPGFSRVPDEEWTRAPVDSLAVKYDAVEKHGWYENLDPTVTEITAWLEEGALLMDYSGGTGILIDRLLHAMPERGFGVVNVDSSPKFLALSLDKLRAEERVAFRLIRYLKEEKRLQTVDEVLDASLRRRGLDGIVSTNAIHLYYDLVPTLRSWHDVLRKDGRVFIQSGNIKNPRAPPGSWIIDDTVRAIQSEAKRIVRADEKLSRYRSALDDAARMAQHDAVREKYFLPPRPLQHYLDALQQAGLETIDVKTRPIGALTREWLDFLGVYHEGVLGWIGGTERVEGYAPDSRAVRDRLDVMRRALDDVVARAERFEATWTYITCRKGA